MAGARWRRLRASAEGYLDQMKGWGLIQCPHRPYTIEFHAWVEGWRESAAVHAPPAGAINTGRSGRWGSR